jgi:hypothetical protein
VGLLLAFTSLGGASSCLYHSSDRCDPGQIFEAENGLCVCDAKQNLIAGDHGCIACGDHQVAANDACGCEDGYTLVGGTCQLVPLALGMSCTADKDCTDAKYNRCHVVAGGGSYCTNTGCADNTGCDGGFGCNTSTDLAYCEQPPSGAGKSCATDADCAGTDATYCENHNSHVCYVEGCSLTANDCFPGKDCCDLTGPSFGTIKKQICVDSGTCPK